MTTTPYPETSAHDALEAHAAENAIILAFLEWAERHMPGQAWYGPMQTLCAYRGVDYRGIQAERKAIYAWMKAQQEAQQQT